MNHPSPPKKRLGIVLATGPEKGDGGLVLTLIRAALAQGVLVQCFVMGEAVLGLEHLVAVVSELPIEIAVCESSLASYGISLQEQDVLLGSQDDHAKLVQSCHRVVAFT